MDNWKTLLADLDDDYLIGIANKGIVKRAYKDKEEGKYQVLSTGESAEVSVGGERVSIRFPLGESRCSCPSRTVCRHVVLGILALREYVEAEAGKTAEEPEERRAGTDAEPGEGSRISREGTAENKKPQAVCLWEGQVDGGQPEQAEGRHSEQEDGGQSEQEDRHSEQEDRQPEQEDRRSKQGDRQSEQEDRQSKQEEDRQPQQAEDRQSKQESRQDKQTGDGQKGQGKEIAESVATQSVKTENRTPRKLLEEIAAYPLTSIRRILGSRRFGSIAGQIKAGQRPRIEHSGIITVSFPEQGHTVKLLSPLEYSACTCHKKDFCIHKAEAVLWCKWEAGVLKPGELGPETGEKTEYDIAQVKEAAGQMKAFLEELLDTGLARVSPDVTDYLERLAVISHNARLARFEGYWRALRDSYGNYLGRKASFRVRGLMEQISRLYKRVELLLEVEDGLQIAELAGEFRAEYVPAGDLDLIGIAIEHFENQAGYEGETVYFLEENTKEWYTYTYARPVFYEKARRRGKPEKTQAPWGVPVTLEELAQARLHLSGAKCDGRGRLSSSQETKGELTGSRKNGDRLGIGEVGGWYYKDFAALYAEQIGKKRKSWLREQEGEAERAELVFLRPQSCKKAFFSETEQKLFMSLFDGAGREVVIEVTYSKRESWGIRYLERVTEEKLPCFLGRIYMRNGRLRMYPVAAFEKGELLEDGWPE